jgi:hypothetical protein
MLIPPDHLIAGEQTEKSYPSARMLSGRDPLLMVLIAIFLGVASMLLTARESSADIYRYVDNNGTVVLTDDLNKVPAEYRKEVVVIREPQKEGKGKPPEKTVKAARDTGKDKGKAEEGFQWEKVKGTLKGFTKGKLLVPALAIVVYLVLFVFVGSICAFFEQRRLGLVLRILLTLGLIFYLSRTL